MAEPLLRIEDLSVDFHSPRGPVRALDRVSLEVRPGEILGVVGESGSGKSTLAQSLMRILPPPAVISGGSVRFEGADLLTLSDAQLRALRWRRMSMVFQSALDALNPVLTVGDQLGDTLRAHGVSGPEVRARCAALLAKVGIPEDRLDSYPHQLSGGMRQRVCIALALALEPSLVILDEPTTALDVVVEREILRELLALRRRLGFAVLFITHDLARMLQVADRVAVFYAGRLVEVGEAARVRTAPRHPYTRALLHAYPHLRGELASLQSIPGSPPSLSRPPPGCRFHPRCAHATERCRVERPSLRVDGEGHAVACHLEQATGAPAQSATMK